MSPPAADHRVTVGTCLRCARIVDVVLRDGTASVMPHGDCPGAGEPPRSWL